MLHYGRTGFLVHVHGLCILNVGVFVEKHEHAACHLQYTRSFVCCAKLLDWSVLQWR